ncbi:MAG: hypothetical protein IKP73_03710 [Bacteroidales bacterium]|nr:hypothetical protein [Bacteroidales bacterium]
MKTRRFKCKLLSDIILNQKSATDGEQQTLDFIPGNCFLGIVAKEYEGKFKDIANLVFHSGKVRFGDAHLMEQGKRSIKIPLTFFQPKFDKNVYYIEYKTNPKDDEIKDLQLKQCRNGFYVFDYNQNTITEIKSEKSFYQKLAYDYNLRRSKDKQMFGYESLDEGKEFCFEVEFDDKISNDIISDVCKELTNSSKTIGRSRTAQYGLVKITDISNETETDNIQFANFDGKEAIVYADGRLIFFDKNGNFTFQPTAQDLGFGDGAEIDWNKSQVRTFSYSPWNHKRKTYDSVREGIEKGSVFVVKTSTSPSGSSYKGLFNNEGFGKIIYNPDLFETDSKGKSVWTKPKNDETPQISKSVEPKQLTTPLLKFLYAKKLKADNQSEAYDAVEVFIDKYKYLFSGDKFASQWGSIRCLAMLYNGEELIKMVDGFLDHGVAKDKWEDHGRKIKLDEFMEPNKNNNLSEKIINLSSEMAKICRTTKTIKK